MKDKMLAAVFEDEGNLRVKEVPVPEIRKDDDVFIKVDAASICGSDLKILEVPCAHPAKKGVVMGHEYAATIIDAGNSVDNLDPGDKVVIEPNIPCRKCFYCRENTFHMCEDLETLGETLDGGFAEYNIAPASQLHRVPKEIPSRESVFVEPLTCVLGAFEKMNIKPADLAVVLGSGPLGLLFTQMLYASGARVLVSEPSSDRHRFAELSGAERVVNPVSEDLRAIIKEHSPAGADIVVDAVGSLMPQAITFLRRYGSLILFGLNDQAECSIKQYDITRNNLRIFGSFIGSGDFPKAIDIICRRKIDVTKLITTELPLSKINEGVDLLKNGKAVKVIIKP